MQRCASTTVVQKYVELDTLFIANVQTKLSRPSRIGEKRKHVTDESEVSVHYILGLSDLRDTSVLLLLTALLNCRVCYNHYTMWK